MKPLLAVHLFAVLVYVGGKINPIRDRDPTFYIYCGSIVIQHNTNSKET